MGGGRYRYTDPTKGKLSHGTSWVKDNLKKSRVTGVNRLEAAHWVPPSGTQHTHRRRYRPPLAGPHLAHSTPETHPSAAHAPLQRSADWLCEPAEARRAEQRIRGLLAQPPAGDTTRRTVAEGLRHLHMYGGKGANAISVL